MAYTHATAAQLAAHFNITVPAMRKALIARELLDEYLNAPTAEGHLIGGAYFVERLSPRYQIFPVWPIDTIAKLLPEISGGADDREFQNFTTRFKAIDALNRAGDLLYEEFGESDSDIGWLCFEHGGDLLASDSRKAKIDFAANSLAPRIARIEARIKRQRRGKKEGVGEALRILRGVHAWAMGDTPKPKPSVVEPFTFDPEPVERNSSGLSFTISAQEKQLLETGFIFIGSLADSPAPCFQQHVTSAMLSRRDDIELIGTFIRMVKRGQKLIMLLVYSDPKLSKEADWSVAAWQVSLDNQMVLTFNNEVDAAPYRPELEYMKPRASGDFNKSRYVRRMRAEIEQLRKNTARLKAETAEIIAETLRIQAPSDLMAPHSGAGQPCAPQQ